jgi:glycosyltransferase involved in cell wall biosynthesis
MRKLLVITDMDFKFSGYFNIAIKLLSGLAGKDYDIKVLGLAYQGQEHTYPFSIIPCRNINDVVTMAKNLNVLWKPDLLLVMLDIPLQRHFFNSMPEYHDRYVALTPMENGPLCMTWAADLMRMQGLLFISELGKFEAQKAGVWKADHIRIGIDTEEWKLPTSQERSNIRRGLGFDDDTFIILTVADNQERKNLWAALSATAELKRTSLKGKIRHIIVTRDNPSTGYNLQDMAVSLGIAQEYVEYRRGMPQKDLWALYAMSDVFLLTSKAEGLGMPVLEAMASGLPVIATDTGAIHEVLADGRGILIPAAYTFIDVWGNSKRDMIDINRTAVELRRAMERGVDEHITLKAREYAEGRTWEAALDKLLETLERVHEQKIPATQQVA